MQWHIIHTSLVVNIKPFSSVCRISIENNSHQTRVRQKFPRSRVFNGCLRRNPIIQMQGVAQSTWLCRMRKVSLFYCGENPEAGSYLNRPSTELVVGVVWWVVRTFNKTSVVVPVKIAEGCVFCMRYTVAAFEEKEMKRNKQKYNTYRKNPAWLVTCQLTKRQYKTIHSQFCLSIFTVSLHTIFGQICQYYNQ